MIAVFEAGVFFHRIIGVDLCGCVEDKEGGGAVVDSKFEEPVHLLGLGELIKIAIFLLMSSQVENSVVDGAEFVNQVVGDLGEIREGVHVVVAGGTEIVDTLVTRERDGVDRSKDVLEGESGELELSVGAVLDLLLEGLTVSDDTGNVGLADLRVGGSISE